jgi:hypothetical protein
VANEKLERERDLDDPDASADGETSGKSDEGVDEKEPQRAEGDEAQATADDEEASDSASLEELLARRSPGGRSQDDSDEDDILSFGPEREVPLNEPLPSRAQPMRDRKEFVCKSCQLVKPRVQLADAQRGYCRDCV